MHRGAPRCIRHWCSHTRFACTSRYRAPDFQPWASLHQCTSLPFKCKAWQTLSVWLQAQLCQISHFLATGRFLITLPPLQKKSMLARSMPWTLLPAPPQSYFRISNCLRACVVAKFWRYRRHIFSNKRIQLLGLQNNERQGDCLKCRN